MAKEVETHLREMLFETIIKEEEKKNLPKRMATILKQQYLNEQNPSREKLYALNNMITQWQRESKQSKSSIVSWVTLSQTFISNFEKFQRDQQQQTPKTRSRELQDQSPAQTEVSQATVNPPARGGGEEEEESKEEAYRWSSRLVDPNKVHGLGEISLSLQRLLVSPKTQTEFKAIGIVGMRGIGKTTLAQLLFSMPEVKSHFFPRIWVCLSKQPKEDEDIRKEVVKRMLIRLGIEDTVIKSANDNHGLPGLLFALRLRLTGKRYLVVLDDVWNLEELQNFVTSLESDEKYGERLAYGLPKGGCGGAVIVTSRAEKAAKGMVGGDNVHRLPLSDDVSCWKIFTDTATEGGLELSPPLESLKEIITKKCVGLPLAAKMMGEIARGDLSTAPQTESGREIEAHTD